MAILQQYLALIMKNFAFSYDSKRHMILLVIFSMYSCIFEIIKLKRYYDAACRFLVRLITFILDVKSRIIHDLEEMRLILNEFRPFPGNNPGFF